MPGFTIVQLVLLEIAGAGVAIGLAAGGAWLVAGGAVAVLAAALAVAPVRRRWLYQVMLSWAGLVRRQRGARRARRPGLAAVLGDYEITTIAGVSGTADGVIRTGTTWSVPLEVRLDNVFNDDVAVPLAGLAALLSIEDVPLASVRLLTFVTPARPPAGAPPGPGRPPARAVTRYCVLTLDAMSAASAVAVRGGSDAAVRQILRRCVLRAEEVLGNAGLTARALDEAGVRRVLDGCLGPTVDVPDSPPAPAAESWSTVQVAGTRSTTVAVAGGASDALARLAEVIPTFSATVAATAVVLRRRPRRGDVYGTLLLRLSASAEVASGSLLEQVRALVRGAGLTVQRLDGEQGAVLRATTPFGVTTEAAA